MGWYREWIAGSGESATGIKATGREASPTRVFGNGTGFVWKFDYSKHHQGAEREVQHVAGGQAGGAHFLDPAELDFFDGPEVFDVLAPEIEEAIALFVLQNDAAGAQAANDGVFRRTEGAVGFRWLNSSQ